MTTPPAPLLVTPSASFAYPSSLHSNAIIRAKASPSLKTNNGAHYSAQMYDQKSCVYVYDPMRMCMCVCIYVCIACLCSYLSQCGTDLGQDVWLEANGSTHIKSSTHALSFRHCKQFSYKIYSQRDKQTFHLNYSNFKYSF